MKSNYSQTRNVIMSENINIINQFNEQGYIIIPQLFDLQQVSELR